jgi:hypothetical protein
MAASDPTDLARHALEQVCSGSDPSAAVGVYSPDFHDHVNAGEYSVAHSAPGPRLAAKQARLTAWSGSSYASCARFVSAGARRAGMSSNTHRPDAAVSAATTAIAPL